VKLRIEDDFTSTSHALQGRSNRLDVCVQTIVKSGKAATVCECMSFRLEKLVSPIAYLLWQLPINPNPVSSKKETWTSFVFDFLMFKDRVNHVAAEASKTRLM
jgi:hypothetical protein